MLVTGRKILSFCVIVTLTHADRTVPGVNPAHYESVEAENRRPLSPHHEARYAGRPLDIEHHKADIQHHYDVPVDANKMSEQELQFHYFKMHDTDNNNMLDGLELVKSVIHWHDPRNHEQGQGTGPEPKLFPDAELESIVDPILHSDDSNSDGFIDYPEFVRAQSAKIAAMKQT
ncbi:unnamed protein product [Notodromas monacha]|uniref:EF-hand domain-containing protein n=1 Tax=Notodromas monacha TaxID=399045 RepID=A0A7R9GDJ2_9CRUS|nr:unnamed protein product [Notodromas monacha]CAG0917268.1 unnamed protein product [Notodromas monacha]